MPTQIDLGQVRVVANELDYDDLNNKPLIRQSGGINEIVSCESAQNVELVYKWIIETYNIDEEVQRLTVTNPPFYLLFENKDENVSFIRQVRSLNVIPSGSYGKITINNDGVNNVDYDTNFNIVKNYSDYEFSFIHYFTSNQYYLGYLANLFVDDGRVAIIENANDSYIANNNMEYIMWDQLNHPTFANVATSGDYNDLSNKPDISSKLKRVDCTQAEYDALVEKDYDTVYVVSETPPSFAYAVLDNNGTMTFIRSYETKETGENQTIEDIAGNTYTGDVYAGVEELAALGYNNMPWKAKSRLITAVTTVTGQTIAAISTAFWFDSCYALRSIDLSNFDTSNVTNMGTMFGGCKVLTSLDVTNFNTSNVTNMSTMFDSCQALTSLDLSNFNTSNVTDMTGMFYSCWALRNLDATNFNTSNVTNMSTMFYSCQALTSLDLSNFDTSNVTNMGTMFYECSALTNLDVTSFNTSNVTNMNNMFYNCEALTTIYANNWYDSSQSMSSSNMLFSGCISLPGYDSNKIGWNMAQIKPNGYFTNPAEKPQL